MGGKHQGIVPVQAEPGERERHRGDGRDYLRCDASGPQRPDDPEKPRVARGEHGDRARPMADLIERWFEAGNLDLRDGWRQVDRVQLAVRPCHAGRERERCGRLRRERAAIAADHSDLLSHAALSGYAATFARPLKSTMIT